MIVRFLCCLLLILSGCTASSLSTEIVELVETRKMVRAPSEETIEAVAPTLEWLRFPNARLRYVCPTGVAGSSGCAAVTLAWSGGVYDTKRDRMIIWGGGHDDWYGNELYAVYLDGRVIRLTEPARPVAPGTCTEGTPDCQWYPGEQKGCMQSLAGSTQPNARHTYNGMAYAPNADKLFVFGGSLACKLGGYGRDAWAFDFTSSTWARLTLPVTLYETPGIVAVYDATSGLVFIHDRLFLYSFNPLTNEFIKYPERANFNYFLTGIVDPATQNLILVGHGEAWRIDLALPTGKATALATTGGEAIVNSGYPGLAYDPKSERITAWNGGDTLYTLDLDTNIWTPMQTVGGPQAISKGTFGRFSYSPVIDGFIAVNSIDDDVRFLRLRPPDPDVDFRARCSASGVVKCYGFDAYWRGEDISPDNVYPDGYGVHRVGLDKTVKVSGPGSLRIWAPSATELAAETPARPVQQNLTGQWSMHGIGGAFAGQKYGPGDTFYVQVRFRVTGGMITNKTANSAWKWFEIINSGSTCGTEGVVFVNRYMTGVATGYTDCGGRGLYPEFDGVANGPYRLQQSDEESGYNCWYSNQSQANCFRFASDVWYAFLFKISIGTWNVKNSSIEGWVAPEGAAAWRKLYDAEPFTLKASDVARDTLNNIVLTGYMTGLTSGWVTPGYMWYDELIISQQTIALPGSTSVSGIIPAAPSGVDIHIGDTPQ